MRTVIGAAIALAVVAVAIGVLVDNDVADGLAYNAGGVAVILGIVALVMATSRKT